MGGYDRAMTTSRSSALPLSWLFLLGGLVAIGPLSTDMYLPAFPAMARDLGGGAMEYTLAGYFIGLSLGQLFYGPLSDRFGRKRPFMTGLALYAIASLGCALADSVEALVAWRFLQALGGCSSMVIVRAVVRDRCDVREAARTFSLLILVMGVTPLLAPVLGGWMGVHLGWRAIFWLMLCYGLLGFAAVAWGLPETHDTRHEPPLRLGRTLADYAGLLASPAFLGYSLAGGFGFAGLFAYIANSPFVFIQLFGVSSEDFGWYFGAIAFGYIAASQINARLLRRASPSRLLRLATWGPAGSGLILAACGLAGWLPVPLALACVFVYMASMGSIGPNAAAAAMATHGQMAGKASALMGSVQFGLATLAGGLVGYAQDGSILPLALIMALGGVGSWLALRWTVSHGHSHGTSDP